MENTVLKNHVRLLYFSSVHRGFKGSNRGIWVNTTSFCLHNNDRIYYLDLLKETRTL